jgi:hypothetical protein
MEGVQVMTTLSWVLLLLGVVVGVMLVYVFGVGR